MRNWKGSSTTEPNWDQLPVWPARPPGPPAGTYRHRDRYWLLLGLLFAFWALIFLIVSGTTPELYGDAILATLFVSLLLNVGVFFSFRVLARGKHKVV